MKRLYWLTIALVCMLCGDAIAQRKSDAEVEASARQELFRMGKKLVPHRKNYIMLGSWDPSLPDRPSPTPRGENKEVEIKFQISFRYPLLERKAWKRDRGLFAYTGRSYWQLYAWDDSAPFRTTDHEPELFWEHDYVPKTGDPVLYQARAGFVHQSNGESGILNRSWNRFYVEGLYRHHPDARGKKGTWGMSVKIWNVFNEATENEDILDYMGPGELRAEYFFADDRRTHLSAMVRNNLWLNDQNRGTFELSVTTQLCKTMRWVAQYFNGYGESLLDYNRNASRFSFGIEFSG